MDESPQTEIKPQEKPGKAYVVAVDMGHGHQRAVFPLTDIGTVPEGWGQTTSTVISANTYPGIPPADMIRWEWTRKAYEWASRMNSFPIFGKRIFHVVDYLQRIVSFYPKRDLSKPTWQNRLFYWMIRRGFGKHLIDTLNKQPLPFVTSFFATAFFAEEHGYTGEIYCLCTDTDIARVWAPLQPEKSRIVYLAPNKRVKDRLELYGVRPEKIVITGFPLPKELLGDEQEVGLAKQALARRIARLDPNKIYQKKYQELLSLYLGKQDFSGESGPVTITFTVGGAGAQAEIGVTVLTSLAEAIKAGRVKLNLIAGTSVRVLNKYEAAIEHLNLSAALNNSLTVMYDSDKFGYFKTFNEIIRQTDVLWTKPSELSFYTGLGLPIIIAPPLGAQEKSNRAWLHMVGGGFEQDAPQYTHEWFFDWLESGWLAEAAMDGFLDASKKGTYHIEDLVLRGKKVEIEDVHFI